MLNISCSSVQYLFHSHASTKYHTSIKWSKVVTDTCYNLVIMQVDGTVSNFANIDMVNQIFNRQLHSFQRAVYDNMAEVFSRSNNLIKRKS